MIPKACQALTISAFIALAGCSSAPSHVILSPQVTSVPSSVFNGQAINFSVQDLRTSNHLIQVIKKDKAAQLYSPNQPLDQVVKQTLADTYKKQGLVTSGGTTSITINIDRALVSVQQELMKYKANSDIQVRVVVDKNGKTLTNTFNSKGNSNGPLQADVAVLERDLNQQLGKVISDIVNNAEIINFIRQ